MTLNLSNTVNRIVGGTEKCSSIFGNPIILALAIISIFIFISMLLLFLSSRQESNKKIMTVIILIVVISIPTTIGLYEWFRNKSCKPKKIKGGNIMLGLPSNSIGYNRQNNQTYNSPVNQTNCDTVVLPPIIEIPKDSLSNYDDIDKWITT